MLLSKATQCGVVSVALHHRILVSKFRILPLLSSKKNGICTQTGLLYQTSCSLSTGLKAETRQGSRLFSTAGATQDTSNMLTIERVPCLRDNYSWLIHDAKTNTTAVVDPAEDEPVEAHLKKHGWTLTHILNTHHHWDHTGSNLSLKAKYNAIIVGPKADQERIPGIDVALADGDTYTFGSSEMRCFDTPGHTKGHITLYFPDSKALFPGDTLFSMGCGRLFEGTPAQMWTSLQKLVALPPDVKVYCAHEYTQSNARFAIHVDPKNQALQKRKQEVDDLRAKNIPTIPSELAVELETNPFLRPFSEDIRASLNIPSSATNEEAFGVIRKAKDNF